MLTYDLCPSRSTRNPFFWDHLFFGARTDTLRIMTAGDSRADGGTTAYIQQLIHKFSLVYNNVPETQPAACAQDGTKFPVKCFLPSFEVSRVDATYTIPSLVPRGLTDARTMIHLWNQNAIGYDGGGSVPDHSLAGGSYGPTVGDDVRFDVFAATNVASGEIAWSGNPTGADLTTESSANLSFAGATINGTTALGLQDPIFAVKKFTSPALPWDTGHFMQVKLIGSSPTQVDLLSGPRFRNVTRPQGVGIFYFSGGGYRVGTISTFYPNSGPLLRAIAPNVILITLGTNDMNVGNLTAAAFKAALLVEIAWFRTQLGPNFPIILTSPTYVRAAVSAGDPASAPALSGPLQAEYDMYAGAMNEIAHELDYVLFINGRRATDRGGWNAVNYAQFSQDGIHENPLGADRRAAADVMLMLGDSTGIGNQKLLGFRF